MATAWVTGPRTTDEDRELNKRQCIAAGFSGNELDDEDDEPDNNTLDIVPENIAAFYWFIEVDTDGFWQYTQGQRHCLDIQTILKDAEITGRKINPEDYKKLKLLGRFVVSAELKAQANKHGE